MFRVKEKLFGNISNGMHCCCSAFSISTLRLLFHLSHRRRPTQVLSNGKELKIFEYESTITNLVSRQLVKHATTHCPSQSFLNHELHQ